MSNPQKEWFSRWLPLIFAVASNLVVVAYGYGQLNQRLTPLEFHVSTDTTDRALAMFVTREEFKERTKTRDTEMERVYSQLKDINSKLDFLIRSRQTGDQ